MRCNKLLLATLMLVAAAAQAGHQFVQLAPLCKLNAENKRESQTNEVTIDIVPQQADYEEGDDDEDDGDDFEFDTTVRF